MPRDWKEEKNPNYIDIQKEELEEKILEGLTSKELADYFNVNQNTITNKVNKFWKEGLRKVRKRLYKINHKHGSCKVCGDPLKRTQSNYCSNECKFSDDEYNKSRVPSVENEENKKVVCKKCDYESKDYNNVSGALTKHRNKKHQECEVDELFEVVEAQEKEYLECPECEWKTEDVENKSGTLTKHIQKSHGNVLEFIEKYPDISKLISDFVIEDLKKEKFLEENEDARIKCEVCGEYFKKLSNTHLQTHGLTPSEYKKKYSVHNLNSTKTNELQSSITRKLNFEGETYSNEVSSYEKDFMSRLNEVDVEYEHGFSVEGKTYDFYFPKDDLLIEIDGEVYHSDNLENLNLTTLNSAINDYEKTMIADENDFNLKRVRYNDRLTNFDNYYELYEVLDECSYKQDYNISYRQKIISKQYFENYIDEKDKDNLKKYVSLLLRFIRTFQSEFPTPESEYSFEEIKTRIRNYDFSKIIGNDVVNNNAWYIGNIYLKSIFKSYWRSSFKGSKSPVEVWKDDRKMLDVIGYRIGCNEDGYVGDFSMRELVKGLSSNRFTVSFFKPLVAASIYDYFLGDIESPVVLDPCAGFGGRLLGFKSLYPNGTYIGLEPNEETYEELNKFSDRFDKVEIYNTKLEDYSLEREVDLTFTSIPYYDTEIYSDHVFYDSFEEWKEKFISSIRSFPNFVVNVPGELVDLFSYDKKLEFENSVSHFDSDKDRNLEYLLKCY